MPWLKRISPWVLVAFGAAVVLDSSAFAADVPLLDDMPGLMLQVDETPELATAEDVPQSTENMEPEQAATDTGSPSAEAAPAGEETLKDTSPNAAGPALTGPSEAPLSPPLEDMPRSELHADEMPGSATAEDGPESTADTESTEKMESETAETDVPAEPAESATETAPAPDEPEALPELSEAMAAFRDRIRRTLGLYYRRPVSTDANTAADVLLFGMAFGCEAEIRHGAGKINAVGCLCWNYPCAGYRLLRAANEGIVPRVGYGFQPQPSQLLAMLGQTAVPQTYELRVGNQRGTVADLVELEKQNCRAARDQSLKLVGLACYVGDDAEWENDIGEPWSLKRILKEELDRTVALDNAAATNRLLGIAYALESRRRSGRPIDGQYERAVTFLGEFYRHALAVQNSDGSWRPSFFAAGGKSGDWLGSLCSTADILHWLAYGLPDSQLQMAEILGAANYLDNSLSGMASRWNFASATPKEMDATTYALAALMMYDRRVFRPHDNPPEKVETTANAAADSLR